MTSGGFFYTLPTMATLVDIANYALGLCAEGGISALSENTPQAKLCSLHLTPTILEVLAEARWKSARKQAVLSQTAAPLFGWAYAYTLPANFIRLVYLNDTDIYNLTEENFEIQSGVLYTDEPSVSITYVANPLILGGDVGKLDPLLVKAIYTALAAKLAWHLQQNRTMADSLDGKAERALRKAKAKDSRDERYPLPNPYNESVWLQSRL